MGHYVALLDILGFKDIINNNPHNEVVDLFKNFRIYAQGSLSNQKNQEYPNGLLTYDVTQAKINSNIISDSIIFWTNNNNANELFDLIECLHSFTQFCHNYPKIFLRGGITYGDFYFHNNGVIEGKGTMVIHPIMVGKALVDAYEIEQKLQIAGCIITEKAIQEAFQQDNNNFKQKWENLNLENKIVQYDMPTKTGNINYWTINWVMGSTESELEEITNSFSSHNKKTDDPGVKLKIENTAQYINHIKGLLFNQESNKITNAQQ